MTNAQDEEPQSKPDLRVVSEDTSRKVRELMRLVVTDGTGGNADAPGYRVAGKTGTAEKSSGGGYNKHKLLSSFVAAFPAEAPRYIVMVMVDEPEGNKKSFGYATAGWVAAPAVSRVIASMGAILGIPAAPPDEKNDLSAALKKYVRADEETEKIKKHKVEKTLAVYH